MTGMAVEPRWARVKWTEAGQVAALLDDLPLDEAEARLPPRDWVDGRAAAGDAAGAIRFLAAALPRLEAVAWAAATLEERGVRGPAERAALDAAARWIQSPDEKGRRAAWAAADAVAEGPARFLGAAVFFSGGSIAPEGLEDVAPPPHACAAAAGATLLGATARAGDPGAALLAALDAGRRIAGGPDAR